MSMLNNDQVVSSGNSTNDKQRREAKAAEKRLQDLARGEKAIALVESAKKDLEELREVAGENGKLLSYMLGKGARTCFETTVIHKKEATLNDAMSLAEYLKVSEILPKGVMMTSLQIRDEVAKKLGIKVPAEVQAKPRLGFRFAGALYAGVNAGMLIQIRHSKGNPSESNFTKTGFERAQRLYAAPETVQLPDVTENDGEQDTPEPSTTAKPKPKAKAKR